jgi:signal transduction histidine kinase
MAPEERIQELERKLAARDKTIAVLVERQLGSAARPATTLNMLEQSISLEQIVNRKTRELAQERAQLEDALFQLKRAQARLLQAQKMESIGQLAAGIAHEINTPTQFVSDNLYFLRDSLGSMLQLLEAAEAGLAQAEKCGNCPGSIAAFQAAARDADLEFLRTQIPDALEQSLQGLARIATIVKAMRNFSHASGDQAVPEDLTAIVQTALVVSRSEWKEVAEVRVEATPELPPVPCLRDEIGQLVLNLVINAAHAIKERQQRGDPAPGSITVSLALQDGAAELKVADNGAGVPEAIRNRIFDPFFTTKAQGVGTGQGLAIAYSTVVEKHKGQIGFESEVGQGTCFTIRLPLQAPSKP